MKKEFDDKSYIEIKKQDNKILIVISAKDFKNPLTNIANCVELDIEEFKQLIKDI
jgi:tRNA threonylcarbamoyladenosine modification (KEOPS) complex  Pcc1 subunit